MYDVEDGNWIQILSNYVKPTNQNGILQRLSVWSFKIATESETDSCGLVTWVSFVYDHD